MSHLKFFVHSQVLSLTSRSSPCLSAVLQLFLLRGRPCPPPACRAPHCHRCRPPLEACHLCRAQACHRPASCHLPPCHPDPCHPPRRPERRFPCTQGVYTTRPLLPWRPVRTLLLGLATHKGAPALQLQNLSRLLLSLRLQQVDGIHDYFKKKGSVRVHSHKDNLFCTVLKHNAFFLTPPPANIYKLCISLQYLTTKLYVQRVLHWIRPWSVFMHEPRHTETHHIAREVCCVHTSQIRLGLVLRRAWAWQTFPYVSAP